MKSVLFAAGLCLGLVLPAEAQRAQQRGTPIRFADRLQEMIVRFRLGGCPFPVPGTYQFTLLVDGAWVAHQRFVVSQREE